MFTALIDRWATLLPRAVAVGVVAITVAALSLLVLHWQREAAVARSGSTRSHTSSNEAIDPLPVILSGNVFGSAASAQAGGTPARQAIGYTLRAAFAEDAGGGGAIIEATGAEARWYEVGDTLGDGAKLREVRPDHVVLDRNGVAERLDFPRLADMPAVAAVGGASGGGSAPTVQRGTSEPIPADASAEEKARIIRQRLEELRNRSRS